MRIVSLLPSATEISYALGLEEQLVGVTFECNEPARAREQKRIIVGGQDTSGMDPAAIDAAVRSRLAAGEDLYTLDAGALAELDPDLILTQDLCRVCAVPTETVRDAAQALGCHAQVVTLDPYSLDDVLSSIADVGAAIGVTGRAETLIGQLRGRIERVGALTAGRPRRRVAVIEWVDPPFGAGHWMPDMITAAGGVPVGCRPRARSVPTDWETIAAERPEIMIISPCGFDLTGAITQADQLIADASLMALFPDVEVWAIDGDGLMVRPGPRLVDGIETLAGIIHPDVAGPVRPAAARRIG